MNPFAFQNPSMLLLLLLVVPLWWLFRRARHKRNAVHAQLGDGVLVRSVWRDRLRLAAVTLLLLALARPGINPQRHSVSKSGRDVVFVLDVSQSMLARDAYPSRLDAAKDGIRDALDSFQSERVALVIYAGSANILCPLTYDYEFARYMLDQATPRAVDFGGTALLSATEKCVDAVLNEDRKGMQDLVVLTDGEEHGPQNSKVVDLLSQQDAGLLMVGIGDVSAGARIPIESKDGSTVYLEDDGHTVTTQLNDSGLRELTQMFDDASYVSAGTAAFDLAGEYRKFASDKPVANTVDSDSYIVYSELGLFFIGLGMALLLLAEVKLPAGVSPPQKSVQIASVAICAFLISGWALAENPTDGSKFADAMQLQEQGRHADALEAYDLVESSFGGSPLSPAQLATLRVNQGMCYLGLAGQQKAEPRAELSLVQDAQRSFLEACRLNPGFQQASQRLDPTASLIAEIRLRIEADDERDQALQEQLQELVERLQQLQKEQTVLRETIPARRPNQRSRKGKSPPEPIQQPDTAVADSKRFADQQRGLHRRGESIFETMKDLDQQLVQANSTDDNAAMSLLREPLQLMTRALNAQNLAVDKVLQWSTWSTARDHQQFAIARIQEILDLLASDNYDESDDGEWDDEEYDELMESSDSENAQMSSMQGQGDFASGSTMQPLPVPNYSVQDILQQEQGNLQFRQQQRAKGNQSKVEKDW